MTRLTTMTANNSTEASRTGVVLINLGTPDAPTAPAIRRYLKEFLSDPRVVDLPRWLWLPLLHLVILNVRPRRLVEKYETVWGRRDGPIRNITGALARRLRRRFAGAGIIVESAMTYGSPSIAQVVRELTAAGVGKLLFVPLYPQYAGATVGAAMDKLAAAMSAGGAGRYAVTESYFQDTRYLDAIADSIRRSYAYRKAYRKNSPLVLFSFHGIPLAQSERGDPYRLQCERTAELIASRLALPAGRWRLAYQSRFGPAEWLRPYTDETLARLPSEGIRDVLVVCPGFAVDCLETIEEIKVLNRDIFLSAGGESFGYVKALNATWAHVDTMQSVIEGHLR